MQPTELKDAHEISRLHREFFPVAGHLRPGRRTLRSLRPGGARCAGAGRPIVMPPPAGAPKVGACEPGITPSCVVVKAGRLPLGWPPKAPKAAAAAGWELPAAPSTLVRHAHDCASARPDSSLVCDEHQDVQLGRRRGRGERCGPMAEGPGYLPLSTMLLYTGAFGDETLRTSKAAATKSGGALGGGGAEAEGGRRSTAAEDRQCCAAGGARGGRCRPNAWRCSAGPECCTGTDSTRVRSRVIAY